MVDFGETPDNVIAFPAGGKAGTPKLPGITDPSSLEREVTVLLAEVRDWTTVSSALGTTKARKVLSKVIETTLARLGDFGGEHLVLDGDPAQPTISCEFEGGDAPVRALRAAIATREGAADTQRSAQPGQRFRIAMGLDTGEITHVSDETLTYQAVGAMRMVAAQLRDFAGPGQIFLTRHVYEEAGPSSLEVETLGDVRISSRGDTKEAFSLTSLSE